MALPTNSIVSSANVLKGGSVLLRSSLSICNNHLLNHHRPLLLHHLSTTPTSSRSSILSHYSFSIKTASSPSPSPFTTSIRFCTAAPSDAVSTDPTTPTPLPADDDDENKKMTIIKEAADTLDIRVGRIVRAWRHEEADSLYVEEVDVGEPQPRIICSGLVNYIPLHLLQDKKVVVLANLKPRNMRGVKSSGMLMAASDASHENVELLVPPEGSLPGERIWFGSEDDKENQPPAATPNQIQKKKIWELVQPHFKTDACCIAMLGVHVMQTTAGVVVSSSLKNANIS